MKPKFKLENYIGKYAMHCNTQEKAEVFCNFLDEQDRMWYDGDSYKKENWWYSCKETTCYDFNVGVYADKEYYLTEGYTVLEFDDFDWDEENESSAMTKKDLKVGYVVKFRDGTFGMIMPSNDFGIIVVTQNRTWLSLCKLNDEMFYTSNNCLDIMEVYGFNKNLEESLNISTKNRTLLWKRAESKKMTVDEISKIVSEHLGYNVDVEVVKG